MRSRGLVDSEWNTIRDTLWTCDLFEDLQKCGFLGLMRFPGDGGHERHWDGGGGLTEYFKASKSSLSASRSTASCSSPKLLRQALPAQDAVLT